MFTDYDIILEAIANADMKDSIGVGSRISH